MDIYVRAKERGNLTGNKLSLGNVCKLYWWPQPLSHKHRTATYLRLGKISCCLMDCIDFYCVQHVVASSSWLLRGWEGNTCYFWVTTSNCKQMHRLPGGRQTVTKQLWANKDWLQLLSGRLTTRCNHCAPVKVTHLCLFTIGNLTQPVASWLYSGYTLI